MALTTGIILGATTLINAYNQSESLKLQSKYQQMQADTALRLAKIQAEDAIKKGDLKAGEIQRASLKIQGAQRAAAAANGIDVSSGSVTDLTAETENLASIDIMTAKNNAWREAWGYRVQANNISGQATLQALGLKNEAYNTLLTGGVQAVAYAGEGAYKSDLLTKTPKTDYSYLSKPKEGTTNSGPSATPKEDVSHSVALSEGYGKSKSKKNPLYPDRELQDSWWIYNAAYG